MNAVAGSGARGLARGFAALSAITFCLIVFGATVRANNAGLACPDWPLCFGEVVPRFDAKIALEWGHRLLAGLVTLGHHEHVTSAFAGFQVCCGVVAAIR